MEGVIRLRAHHLLCLLGFRGYGYSPKHKEKLAQLQARLLPSQPLEVLDSPDGICICCPWLREEGCGWAGQSQEEKIQSRDRKVMAWLRLVTGKPYLWGELRERIRKNLKKEDLLQLCATCHWLPLGYCREGLENV